MQQTGAALVTGAARRVGKIVSQRLARGKFAVAVHYRAHAKEANALVRLIRREGGQAAAFRADLSSVLQIRNLVRSVEKRLGPIRLLVNSASVFQPTPILSINEKTWDKILATNLKSVFFLSREVARGMLRRQTGVIINIEDAAVYRPYPGYVPYLVSKAGVAMLTRLLAMELGPVIRVAAVSPGPVLLPEHYGKSERRRAVRRTILKREGTAEDVAEAVLFLAEKANYTTGTTVFVDGGRTVL